MTTATVIQDEAGRRAAAKRLAVVRADLALIQERLAGLDHSTPAAVRDAAQALVSRRAAFDAEQLGLEKALRAYRDPRVLRFLREVRDFIRDTGVRYQLPAGESESSLEGAIERSAGHPATVEALQKRLDAYRVWTRDGYGTLDTLCSRIVAAIFHDAPLEETLRSCARSFDGVRNQFRGESIIEQLLGGGR